MTDEVRKFIKRTFSSRGIILTPSALTFLTEQLVLINDRELQQKTLEKLYAVIQRENAASEGFLDIEPLKNCISHTRRTEYEVLFDLQNFIEWRKALSDKIKPEENKWEILANKCMRMRFCTVRQSIEPAILEGFVPTESLFSKRNCNLKVLGMLSQESSSSKLSIEDFFGEVRVNLKCAMYEPGLYFEGGVYVFEGSFDGSEFMVNKVSLPPTKKDIKQVVTKSTIPSNNRMVFLSDLRFDNSKILEGLSQILEGFKSDPPDVFVLFGPFTEVETANDYTNPQLDAFKLFADLLKKFIVKNQAYIDTHFILIPSFEDPPYLATFPRPPFQPKIRDIFAQFNNVHFGSNPCRLVYKDRSFLFFRDDIVEKLCRGSLHMPENANIDTIPKLFCSTIASQLHISPLPLHYNPVNPNFDCLFQLCFPPDVVVIGDKYKAFSHQHEGLGIQILNPGSFLYGNHEFIVYYPGLKRAELSALPSD